MKKCKYCEQKDEKCICNEVESFFENSWDLLDDDSWKATVPPIGIKDDKVNN